VGLLLTDQDVSQPDRLRPTEHSSRQEAPPATGTNPRAIALLLEVAMPEYALVLVTAPSVEEAESLGRLLLDRRLVACANLVPGLTSLFWWEGKLDRAEEVLVLMKTRQELLPQVTQAVVEAHSYEVCEVIALPIVGGSEAYLRWIDESLRQDGCRA